MLRLSLATQAALPPPTPTPTSTPTVSSVRCPAESPVTLDEILERGVHLRCAPRSLLVETSPSAEAAGKVGTEASVGAPLSCEKDGMDRSAFDAC